MSRGDVVLAVGDTLQMAPSIVFKVISIDCGNEKVPPSVYLARLTMVQIAAMLDEQRRVRERLEEGRLD